MPSGASVPEGLWPGSHAPLVLAAQPRYTNHDLYLVHHFTQHTARGFEGEAHAGLYSRQVLALALERPFLMHAMVALAACHLQHLDTDARRFRPVEAFHCNMASQGLRNAVSVINNLQDSDSVLSTAMLLNTLTFCAADYRDEEAAWNDVNLKPCWNWLRIQIGLTELLSRTKDFLAGSMWTLLFKWTNDFQILGPRQSDLDVRIARFCNIDETSTSENNPYFDFVQLLGPLVIREPCQKYLPLYVRAVGGISNAFVDLLESQDHKALLLLAHWFALMCSIDQWWCVRRTRLGCRIMCKILSQELDDNDIKLLALPAWACGFDLSQRRVNLITA